MEFFRLCLINHFNLNFLNKHNIYLNLYLITIKFIIIFYKYKVFLKLSCLINYSKEFAFLQIY